MDPTREMHDRCKNSDLLRELQYGFPDSLVLCLVFERQSMLLSYIARGSYPLLPTPQLALSTPPAA